MNHNRFKRPFCPCSEAPAAEGATPEERAHGPSKKVCLAGRLVLEVTV